jgi:hypothetical protein
MINVAILTIMYRHLKQQQDTIDGNFHTGKYRKNTDPDDVSLCEGKAYFPLDKPFKEYLANVPVTAEVCPY